MSPKVSVIIPAYNTQAYVVRAVESALGQTERDIEVIVVDDASTDATVEVVKGFSNERLRLVVNERNRAIKEAKRDWVAPLDSDDWYAPRRIERLLRVARAEGADMVADDVYFIQDGEEIPWSTLLFQSKERFDRQRRINAIDFVESNMLGQRRACFGLTKPLMRRHFLIQQDLTYGEVLKHSENFFLYLVCLLRGARFVVVPEPIYFYCRGRPGSILSKDKLELLTQARDENLYLLQQEIVREVPRVARSLFKRLLVIERGIRCHRIAQPSRRKETSRARWPKRYAILVSSPPLWCVYRISCTTGSGVMSEESKTFEMTVRAFVLTFGQGVRFFLADVRRPKGSVARRFAQLVVAVQTVVRKAGAHSTTVLFPLAITTGVGASMRSRVLAPLLVLVSFPCTRCSDKEVAIRCCPTSSS